MLKPPSGERSMINRMQKPLYRHPHKGKIFGVCAGVADSFGWDAWAVRAVTLLAGFLTGFGPVCIAYLIAFFILDPLPSKFQHKAASSADSGKPRGSKFKQRVDEAKSTFSKQKEPCSEVLKRVELSLLSTQDRVEKMEAFVTSGRYELEREFQKMGRSA